MIIYILEEPTHKFLKLGITINLDNRLKQYKTHNPIELVLRHNTTHEHYKDIERLCHKDLEEYRIHGEWYNCSYEEVKRVLDYHMDNYVYIPKKVKEETYDDSTGNRRFYINPEIYMDRETENYHLFVERFKINCEINKIERIAEDMMIKLGVEGFQQSQEFPELQKRFIKAHIDLEIVSKKLGVENTESYVIEQLREQIKNYKLHNEGSMKLF